MALPARLATLEHQSAACIFNTWRLRLRQRARAICLVQAPASRRLAMANKNVNPAVKYTLVSRGMNSSWYSSVQSKAHVQTRWTDKAVRQNVSGQDGARLAVDFSIQHAVACDATTTQPRIQGLCTSNYSGSTNDGCILGASGLVSSLNRYRCRIPSLR